MRTGILSSTLLRTIHNPEGLQLPGIAAASNKFNRIANKLRAEGRLAYSVINSPTHRATFERRQAIRHILRPDHEPIQLPPMSVSKLARRAS